MIFVLFDELPDCGKLRIVSDEPGSAMLALVELSFRAFLPGCAFDGGSRTWFVTPEARHDFGRWVNYAALICGAHFHVERDEQQQPSEPERPSLSDEWPEFI
jgi:hypothetical protein